MLFRNRALMDRPARLTKDGHLVAITRVARASNMHDYAPPRSAGRPARLDGGGPKVTKRRYSRRLEVRGIADSTPILAKDLPIASCSSRRS